ncbi:MAG: protein translocase subunit SecF [Coriobacteriales bacterium]|nr:protein translocase subunit SecF [Coriobacteriales bacterium]
MARPFKRDINFLGHRRILFIISGLMIIATCILLPLRGLNFGIEFVGGSSMEFKDTGGLSIETMRETFNDADIASPIIQTSIDARTGAAGFIVRVPITDAQEASQAADRVVAALELNPEQVEVSTINPSWGAAVTQTSLLAFGVAMLLIIIYIAFRFEYKMGISSVISLIHDLVIIVGIYSLSGREVSPNVIAALLTIMGYSLYDSVVVFHRVNDNMGSTANHSFITVSNHSINQVLMRTINTTLAAMIPVVAMLFFGGETLRDFAFAMTIGLVLGPYSSIAIAAPIYALWKQREPKYKKQYEKFGEGMDVFTTAEQLGE